MSLAGWLDSCWNFWNCFVLYWEAIINDNVVPFLANPLTGQTGTGAEKKSLLQFFEEIIKSGRRIFSLSEAEDNIGRKYVLNMHVNKRIKSTLCLFEIYCWCPYSNEDGTPYLSEVSNLPRFNFFGKITVTKLLNPSVNELWNAHFKASCEFDSIVNQNCLCEYRKHYLSTERYYLSCCKHKKATNSKFCFGHMHTGCIQPF